MISVSLSVYLSIPVVPTWSKGHPGSVSFQFSFLILDSRYDSLDEGSARRKAGTYTQNTA
jgi:hypothetical protein